MSIDLARPYSYLAPARKANPEPHTRLKRALDGVHAFATGDHLSNSDIEILAMIVNVATDTIFGLVLMGEYVEEDKMRAVAIADRTASTLRTLEDKNLFKLELAMALQRLSTKI